MSLPSGYTLISPGTERIDDFIAVDSWAFMFEPRAIDAEFTRSQIPASRARAVQVTDARRGTPGELAGVYSAYDFGMLVPGGGVVDTAGLTWVGVHPGHRRRGLLREMIDDHFAVSLAAGKPVSALYAMEAPIYGRFGYGSAAPRLRMNLGAMADVAGADALPIRFERIDVDRHTDVVLAVHARMSRPGTVVTPAPQMLLELLADSPSDLEDGERSILAIVEDEHGPAAYARFKRTLKFEGLSPSATLVVGVGSAATPLAARRLYGTLRELDLIDEALIRGCAPDDPIVTLATNIRSLKAVLIDALWVRILDLPAAFAARRFAADLDVVLDVTDAQLPANAGTWRVRITNGEAEVTRTEAAADASVSIQDLSGAYLGSEYVRRAALAGLLTESTPGTLAALNAAMRGDQEPLCNMWF